jgi:cinnamyl-alcohol dehydrogenase
VGFAAHDSKGHLVPFEFSRRPVGDDDVSFKIEFCGICHSDLHQIKNEWKGSKYPMVPGHELVGIVDKVGSKVTNFKVGQKVGVGCIVNSCRKCESCQKDEENYCESMIGTYNGTDKDGSPTYGGYSSYVVVNEKYVLHVPDNLDFAATAPLLCAGITTYSPMRYYGMDKPGKTFGVVGLGGLGHMAVQFGKAFGMHVIVFSTSPNKKEEALKGLGADEFVVTKDEEAMKAYKNKVDYILDTVSAKHPLAPYLNVLKPDGKLILVGMPPEAMEFAPAGIVLSRKLIGGSMIGGIKETQEMLDFCGKHDITCKIEKIPMDYVNTAMDRLVKNDVKYRFVLDVAKTMEKAVQSSKEE